MSLLEIVGWPGRVLETRSEEVRAFDDKLQKFVADMHETMDQAGGIGLAANQVNSLQRILTIRIPWSGDAGEEHHPPGEDRRWWHDKRFTFINPIITKKIW